MQPGTRRHSGIRVRAAAAGALREFRAELERRPRDPFAVDARRAADALTVKWGDSYAIKPCQGGVYEAVRRHGPRVSLTAETPDDLERKMLADWASW